MCTTYYNHPNMKRPSSISVSGVATPVALASTVEHGAVLVTGDPGFRAVERLVTMLNGIQY
jgi:hypothetical protein